MPEGGIGHLLTWFLILTFFDALYLNVILGFLLYFHVLLLIYCVKVCFNLFDVKKQDFLSGEDLGDIMRSLFVSQIQI